MSIGEKLSLLRKQRGMTQMELAEELDVSRQAVSRWEQGLSNPSTDNLVSIAQLFGVSIDVLANDSPAIGYEEQRGESNGQSEAAQEKVNYHKKDRTFYLIGLIGHLVLSVIICVAVCFMLKAGRNKAVEYEGGDQVQEQEQGQNQDQEQEGKTREEIIYSKSWTADGVVAFVRHRDGTIEKIPEFSEVFPGWEIPKTEPREKMDSSAYIIDDANQKECFE